MIAVVNSLCRPLNFLDEFRGKQPTREHSERADVNP